MGTRFLLLLGSCLAFSAPAQIALQLELVSDVFSDPVDIAGAGDDRLFIVEKGGRIRILRPDGQAAATPFLDIDARVNSAASERGLLGLAFHPDYAENGYFFVNYTNNDGNTVVARYEISGSNPDLADINSEQILLTVNQPAGNHNGGDLNFGPDGYLYIALGDGGGSGDPSNYGQNRRSMLGKLLRIDVDVDNGALYAIPENNPFVSDTNTLDEIWALGLRNPWRFSFDRLTGDLWIGDVGQGNWEEIDFQPAGSPGGENYGWRCYEGMAAFRTDGCGPTTDYTFPVYDYQSELPTGCSVTGGFVYRGATYPLLYGKYIYADYCSSKIWALSSNDAGEWVNEELHDGPNFQYVSMGESSDGELYLAAIGGSIYRLTDQTTKAGEATLNARLVIRPNPFDDQISIAGRLPEGGNYRLRLFNALGKEIWSSLEYLDVSFTRNIATAQLPGGIYFFSIERNGARRVEKVIKR